MYAIRGGCYSCVEQLVAAGSDINFPTPEGVTPLMLALDNEQAARQLIDRTATMRNPFDAKYSKVEDADWETCNVVVNPADVRDELRRGW